MSMVNEAQDLQLGLSGDEFKAAFRNHPAGVALITADGENGPVAMTASSVSSVSVEPALLIFSASAMTSCTPVIRDSETVVVHLLSAEQIDLALLGATRGIDRFADKSLWSRLDTGEPYFPRASSWIRGRVVNSIDVGTATIIVVHGINAHTAGELEGAVQDFAPLVYHNRSWHQLSEHSRIA